MEILIETCGWVGALLVLAAYFLISSKKVSADSLTFQLMNVGGAATLIVYTYARDAHASVLVNSIWVLIGLKTLIPYISNLLKLSAIKAKDVAFDVAVESKDVLHGGINNVVVSAKVAVQEVVPPVHPDINNCINEKII